MTRETKLNLVFLSAFLLLCLPGVVILFIKKLDPKARSMAEASYVRRSDTYNNPLPTGSKSIRVVPPATFEWVESLSTRHTGAAPLRHSAAGGRIEPVMSEGRRFELIQIQEKEAGRVLVLLAWAPEFGARQVTDLEAEADHFGPLQEVQVQPEPVPAEVVTELKDAGFVVPPANVALLWLTFAAPQAPASEGPADGVVRMSWSTASGSRSDVLDLEGRLLHLPDRAKDAAGPAADDAGQGEVVTQDGDNEG